MLAVGAANRGNADRQDTAFLEEAAKVLTYLHLEE
jgi:hypothetical protein